MVPNTSRAWIRFDGSGNQWAKSDDFDVPHNLVIRAVVVTDQTTGVAEERTLVPSDYVLEQNFPNPFNPETKIEFQLPQASHVLIKIFNRLGQEIRALTDKQYQGGLSQRALGGKDNSGREVSSGIYLYQLKAGKFSRVRKMSLLR